MLCYVRECSKYYFLKYFLFRNIFKKLFFKIFLILMYLNNLKILKINLKLKKWRIFKQLQKCL